MAGGSLLLAFFLGFWVRSAVEPWGLACPAREQLTSCTRHFASSNFPKQAVLTLVLFEVMEWYMFTKAELTPGRRAE